MYFLCSLYFVIPLFFSHIFARWWSGFIIDNGIGHFESLKMSLFLMLMIFATLEMFLQKWEKWKYFFQKISQKYFIVGLSLFFIIGILIYPHENLRDLLLGIWEKQHGILLPLGLIWLGILISLLEKSEIRKISYAIIISASLVSLIALIEMMGYNIFTWSSYGVVWSWWEVRSTSTLGNPNYVAGYLLMVLPIIFGTIKRGEKYTLMIFIFLAIFSTGSIIGISLAALYFIALISEKIFGKKTYIYLPLVFILMILVVYYFYHGNVRWLSLISRFILMRETSLENSEHIGSFLFWSGPSGILDMYEAPRSALVNSYFPANMIIDSSHNLFIDIFVQYGMVTVLSILGYIFYQWKCLDTMRKSGLILGLIFLSLNVFVISHLILIVFFISEKCLTKNLWGIKMKK